MARRTFFSFHYTPDVLRAWIVRNSWVTRDDRQDAGFFDSSVFESKERESPEILKRFLRDGLSGSSVTCVLVGEHTNFRRWVRYELLQSFVRGNGLLAVRINGIAGPQQMTTPAGPNPFDNLAFTVQGDRVDLKEYFTTGWGLAQDVPSMALSDVAYNLRGMTNNTFSCLFPIYDYTPDSGYHNLPGWIEGAALAAGR